MYRSVPHPVIRFCAFLSLNTEPSLSVFDDEKTLEGDTLSHFPRRIRMLCMKTEISLSIIVVRQWTPPPPMYRYVPLDLCMFL